MGKKARPLRDTIVSLLSFVRYFHPYFGFVTWFVITGLVISRSFGGCALPCSWSALFWCRAGARCGRSRPFGGPLRLEDGSSLFFILGLAPRSRALHLSPCVLSTQRFSLAQFANVAGVAVAPTERADPWWVGEGPALSLSSGGVNGVGGVPLSSGAGPNLILPV